MINGRVFDWESIKINSVWGINIEIKNISYSSEVPAEAVYGRGNSPRGYGKGNLVQDASIDIPNNSWNPLLIYAATQGGLFRIRPFPIVVSYANSDQIPQVDTLRACVFTKVDTEAGQGDTEIAIRKLTLKVFNPILYSGVPAV